MIMDKIENFRLYFTGSDWDLVANFLSSLDINIPEGDYVIKGTEIFCKVMSYDTIDSNNGTLEAHHRYIDIQTVLVGGEGIAWHPTDRLKVSKAYDEDNDVEFYFQPVKFPARIDVTPGYFMALFPHDAHMPQLRVKGEPPTVKKIVIKVQTKFSPGMAIL